MSSTETARAAKPARKITVLDIKGRDWISFGKRIERQAAKGQHAIIVPGKSVTLLGDVPDSRIHACREHEDCRACYAVGAACARAALGAKAIYRKSFAIGDTAEYDSYNIAYLGTITAIGEKTVTITAHGRAHRLDLATFNSRNWDLDMAATMKRNSEWMD